MSKKNDDPIDFSKSTDLAVTEKEPVELEVQKTDNSLLASVDVTHGNLPDLDDAKEIPIDLMSNYWTPVGLGEAKRVFFDTVKNRMVADQQSGEMLDLPCAHFFEKVNGEVKTISNGSKRLVGLFENGQIPRGTPVLITYLGKKKNATNGFQSDSWSVRPLSLTAK